MASSIEELFDMLYEMIDEAKNVPLSSDKCMLERDKALDLLDDIRARFPVDFKKAKELVEKKNDYIASAKREADDLRQRAEEHVRRILNEDAMTMEARRVSQEIIEEAEKTSRQLKQAANEYCEDTLRRMEEAVADAYDEVKHSRAKFRSALGAGGSMNRAIYDADEDDI
jgi:ATP-dependent Clp protease ATP-binding subunit ClpA